MNARSPSSEADRAAGSNLLGSTLFFAALVHGVIILGVSFTAGIATPGDEPPSLKVTLLTDAAPRERAPDDAEYIANRDQQGAGTASDGSRPTTAVSSPDMLSIDGSPQGADLETAVPREQRPAAEELVTRRDMDREVAADPNSTEPVSDIPKRAANSIDLRSRQTLATEIDLEAQLPDSDREDETASPSARASVLAAYLNHWRQRIERIGTLNFPERFLAGNAATQSPTLEVAIAVDGSLSDIIVRRSSGDRAVDQAAVTILRMAAPFQPLPDTLRLENKPLRVAYEWDFIENAEGAAPE